MPLDLPDQLAARLARTLPGSRAQAKQQPELSYGRHFHSAPAGVRQAAVMALLYRDQGGWRFPLVIRPRSMAAHAGQISLPGGVIDPDETDREAAQRELEEELGVPPAGVRLLGRLSTLHLFVTQFEITPWVASIDARPLWHPSPAEVSQLLEVPLDCLADPTCYGHHVRGKRGVQFLAPHIQCGPHHIWGATAMILAELAAVLDDLHSS